MKLSEYIEKLQFFKEKLGDKKIKFMFSDEEVDGEMALYQTINDKDFIEFNFGWKYE